jgi:hypothetical protein
LTLDIVDNGAAGPSVTPERSPARDTHAPGGVRIFQAVSARNLQHARNVLLLLRTQRSDLLEESLEARGRFGEKAETLMVVPFRATNAFPRKTEVGLLAYNLFQRAFSAAAVELAVEERKRKRKTES